MHALRDETVTITSPSGKANLLASFFASVFSDTLVRSIYDWKPQTLASRNSALTPVEKDIHNILIHLRGSRNAAPDHVPQLFYKKFAVFLAELLYIIFSKSYESGIVPSAFRKTTVTPIFEKGAKELVANYRPIAQGCIAAKVFEKLIANNVQEHLLEH